MQKISGFSSRIFFILLSLNMLFIFSGCQNEAKLGTQDNPIKLYFTPSVDSETIAINSREFINFLETDTGLFFETGIPTNYISVVESFGSKRADIAVMNSFGYLLANEKYGARARLTVIRYGLDYYRGEIIARNDRGINGIRDLEGKKFAFTDSSSTSGYMFPLKLLKDHNVNLGQTVFAIKHDNVVTMVYQGQVDAGACFYSPNEADGTPRDARMRVKTQFPDVLDKVKVLVITDKIPNDPFVFRKDLPKEIEDKFISSLKKFLATEKGKTAFRNIYSVDGVVDSTDESYDGLRKMVKAIELDKEKFLKSEK